MALTPELKAFHDHWAHQQRVIVETLRPLTPEQVQLRAAPTEWAIWQLAGNMVGGRMYWLCFMLGEDDQGVGPEWTGWEDEPEHPRTADELVQAFEKTWEVAQAAVARWSAAELTTELTRNNFWGQPTTISPAWVMCRLLAHEVHHGSEISLILRVHGLETQINL